MDDVRGSKEGPSCGENIGRERPVATMGEEKQSSRRVNIRGCVDGAERGGRK